MIFAEPDRGAAFQIVETMKTHYAEITQDDVFIRSDLLKYFDEVKSEHDYDEQLTNAIKRSGKAILGIAHYSDPKSVVHLTPEQRQIRHQLIRRVRYALIKSSADVKTSLLRVPSSPGVETNLPKISEAAKSFGHGNMTLHSDGYVRWEPLLIEYEKEYYPTFSLEVARAYLNPTMSPIIHSFGEKGRGSVDAIQLANIFIPTDEAGRLLINYYGPAQTFPHYSLSDILFGRVPPSTFKDKIVLVGFTGFVAHDIHSTSFQMGTYPGVKIHATVIENILRGDFLTKSGAVRVVDGLILLVIGVAMGFILPRIHPLMSVLTVLIGLMSVARMAYFAFLFQKIWLNVTFPFLFIILNYFALIFYKLHTLEKVKNEE